MNDRSFTEHPAFLSLPEPEREYFRDWIRDDAAEHDWTGPITIETALHALESMLEAEQRVLKPDEPYRLKWIQTLASVIVHIKSYGVKPALGWA